MKLRTSKILAVLCVVAMVMSMIVPMTLTAAAADAVTETISFANTTQRESLDGNKQVWKSENVTFTNNKASSSNNVADYVNPVRLYQGSTVTITAPGTITEIVIVSNGTAKYKTALENSLTGAGLAYTNSGNNYTVTPGTETVTFSMTAQARFVSISVTYEVASEGECAHDNYETISNSATCTEDGEHVFNCLDCGETITEAAKATGHNFVDNVCTACGVEEFPEFTLEAALAAANGTNVKISNLAVIFVHTPWKSNATSVTVQDMETGATLYVYKLATEVAVGDIITVKGRMDTYNNKRQLAAGGTAEVSGETVEVNPAEVTIAEAKELDNGALVLVKGTVSKIKNAWNASYGNMDVTITDTEGNTLDVYRLRTQVNVGDAIAVTGVMDTYSNARQIAEGATAEFLPGTEIFGTSVNVGVDLSVLVHISLAYGEDVADYAVKFVHENGAEFIATDAIPLEGDYVFILDRIAPQAMSDLIDIVLMKGDEEVETFENFSIKEYSQIVLLGEHDDAVKTFVSDMLTYGAAAQKHTGYNLDNLATDGVEGLVCSTATPDASENVNKGVQNGEVVEGLGFTAVGVGFDFVNYIYAKFTAASLEGITVTIDGEEAYVVEEIGDGEYIAYSYAIIAAEFANAHTIVLNNGADYQTVTYSVNSYATANADTELGIALYRYGVSAAALIAMYA